MKQDVNKKERPVLLVDGGTSIGKRVRRILKKEHLEVDEAFRTKEVLDMLEKKPYRVVITDMMRPAGEDMNLLRMVKEKRPEISVITITGYPTIKTAVQIIKSGAFDCLPRPFTPEELTSVTIRALERTRIYKGKEVEGKKGEGVLEKEGDLYCIPEHAWVRIERDGNVRIGMEDIFLKTAGEIINIDLPFEGDEVRQGDVCAYVTSSGLHIHKLWSPVTGKAIEVNEAVNKDCLLANEDPRGEGWLIKAKPANLKEDLENLVQLPGR